MDKLILKCSYCATEIIPSKIEKITLCPFCKSELKVNYILPSLDNPEYVLPFKVSKNDARKKIIRWCNNSHLKPFNYKKKVSSFKRVTKIFVPFWIFNCHVKSNYTTHSNNKNYKIYGIKKYEVTSFKNDVVENDFDDIIISASNSLEDSIISKISPWDIEAMESVDENNVNAELAENCKHEAHERFDKIARSIVTEKVKNYIRKKSNAKFKKISLYSDYSQKTFRLCLFPIYVSVYRNNGEIYKVYVNGRTGKTFGSYPVSRIKFVFSIFIRVIISIEVFILVYFLFLGNKH